MFWQKTIFFAFSQPYVNVPITYENGALSFEYFEYKDFWWPFNPALFTD
jgi:hypothetical protein